MKVKALEAGFFAGNRVREGAVFEVPEGTKGKWFVPVDEVKAEPAPKAKGKKEPSTLAEAAKETPSDFTDAMA